MGSRETPWEVLESHLIRAGHLTPEGVGRRAQPRRCRSCNRPTLVGLDDERCCLRAEADPQPTTALGEMLAHLEGRRTYALVRDAGRIVLDYRDAGRITYRPACSPAASRLDVVVEHRCPDPSRPTTRFPPAPSHLVREHHLIPSTEGAPCPF